MNTRFFDQYASARKKNKIQGLYDASERWVTSKVEINRVVLDYFGNIFVATESLQDIDHIISVVRSSVTAEDN